jgi:hypothetical protein
MKTATISEHLIVRIAMSFLYENENRPRNSWKYYQIVTDDRKDLGPFGGWSEELRGVL